MGWAGSALVQVPVQELAQEWVVVLELEPVGQGPVLGLVGQGLAPGPVAQGPVQGLGVPGLALGLELVVAVLLG